MTTPSIKFQCPKCNKIEKHISDGPHHCQCGGGKQTVTGWSFKGPVSKVRTETKTCGVRMKKI